MRRKISAAVATAAAGLTSNAQRRTSNRGLFRACISSRSSPAWGMDEFKETFVPEAEKLSPPDTHANEIYVLPSEDGFNTSSLIVGPYDEIRQLNADLRVKPKLREYLEDAGVRYGTRWEDLTPELGKQLKLPERLDNSEILRNAILKLEEEWGHARYSDLDPEWKESYATKSNHAHHLVPDMVPRNTGISSPLLLRARAPAVLVRTEVHQQLFHKVVTTEELDPLNTKMSGKEIAKTLESLLVGVTDKNGDRFGGLFNRPGWKSLIRPTIAVIQEVKRAKNKKDGKG